MYEWQRARGIQDQRGRSWRDENGHDYIRWCFADPAIADVFKRKFGDAQTNKRKLG